MKPWNGSGHFAQGEMEVAYERVFGQRSSSPGPALMAAILSAVSPLRLDYEINRQRGFAIDGETKHDD